MARGVEYKTRPQMRVMARAGLVVADALEAARAAAVPGATTADVDASAARVIEAAGATSNFLGYYGFPAVSCVSINDEIVHGIPGPRVIQDGDIVSIDCGAIIEGWHGDSALSLIAGMPRGGQDTHLVDRTKAALWAGIAVLTTARRLDEVSGAIEDVADDAGVHPLVGYVGHGIGTAMHQAPDVLNYRTRGRHPKVKPGMCLAIEPMFVIGTSESSVLDDEWTVVSADGSRAAHWEHSVAIHEDGIWVLTSPDGGAAELAAFGIVPVAP